MRVTLASRTGPRHDALYMIRFGSLALLPWLAIGCTGETLDAGSYASDSSVDTPLAAASTPTTRATIDSLIDAFAMDADSLYFTAENGSLYRLAKTGGSAPQIIAPAATPGSVYAEGIALDDDNVYWTALGDGVSTGAVLSVPKSGGSPNAIAIRQARPTGIAVDDTDVFWSNQGAPPPMSGNNNFGMPVGAAILTAPKGGGTATALVTDPDVPDVVALDATGVIWHEQRAIRRVPKTGGASTTLSQAAIPWKSSNLVVAASTLYWAANQSGWSLQSVALDGGTVATLVSPIDAPGGVFLDGASLFWDAANGQTVGAIEGEATDGGSAVVEAAPPDLVKGVTGEAASFFLADASAFYWVEYWEAPDASTPTVAIRVLTR
jgi:hypothetical protein